MRELGWVEGQSIVIDYRVTEGRVDRLPDFAAELVRLKVDVIWRCDGPTIAAKARASWARQRVEAVLVVADALFVSHRAELAGLEAKHRIPSIHSLRANVEAGGFMSYGPDIEAIWRRAAFFVDRILRGAKPGDLPVEQPTKYQLVLNLRTAKTLGLTIPPAVLARAYEVIQ